MPTLTKREAIVAAQTSLSLTDRSVVVDGKWGSQTDSTYNRSDSTVKAMAASSLAKGGLTVETVRNSGGQGSADVSDTSRYLPVPIVEAKIRAACVQANFTSHSEDLVAFARFEARKVVSAGQNYYDARSVNGSSRGLLQMQPAAWTDAKKANSSLPGYDRVFDADANIAAGVAYAMLNAKQIRKAGFPVNGETLYLAHNQGAGFFTRGARTAVGNQSKEVQALIAKYSR